MDMKITYYCPDCYREFKTLSHFNGYRSRCTPYLRADGRRRLEVRKVDGRWILADKKTVKDAPKEKPVPMPEKYGTDIVKVGRSTVTAEWEIDEDGLYFETYWTKGYDGNFEFIAKAEKAVAKYLEEKLGMKFFIIGGTGSKGYRSTNADVK